MAATRRAKLISEARLPYLTNQERQTLARSLDRLETHAGDRVRHVIFFGSKARGDALIPQSEHFVARIQRFLEEHGFEPTQDE